MKCQNCGNEIKQNADFSGFCGRKIEKIACGGCGAKIIQTDKFCPICGAINNSAIAQAGCIENAPNAEENSAYNPVSESRPAYAPNPAGQPANDYNAVHAADEVGGNSNKQSKESPKKGKRIALTITVAALVVILFFGGVAVGLYVDQSVKLPDFLIFSDKAANASPETTTTAPEEETAEAAGDVISETEPNSDELTANSIQPGTLYSGNLSNSTDMDFFTFDVTETGKYELYIKHDKYKGTGLAWGFTISGETLDGTTTYLSQLDAGELTHKDIDLVPGTYYIKVHYSDAWEDAGAFNNGTYTFGLKRSTEWN